MDICLSSNPQLKVSRARFSALTYDEITRAMDNLEEPNLEYMKALKEKREADFRV